MITAKVIADSITEDSVRLTTLECVYPLYIHPEVMTHRAFSRNGQSTRAIPIERYVQIMKNNPVEPIFMKNKSGMSAVEPLNEEESFEAHFIWYMAREAAEKYAFQLLKLGVHKQIVNRLLMPFANITMLISATEWDNFFDLRIHPDAQQEIQELAIKMRDAIYKSEPRVLKPHQWHLPYITVEDTCELDEEQQQKVSVARCARVSYLNHDKRLDYSSDFNLYDRLLESKHMSPFEHVATTLPSEFKINPKYQSNFYKWIQLRKFIENENE